MEAAKSSPRTVWTLKTLSLVGLVFILLISASIGVVSYQNHVNQVNTDTTDRTATSITSLATTVHAPSDVTATAQAATVIAINPNPYPPSTGTLVFYDSLSKPLQWRDQSFSNVGGCHFLNGAYHVSNGASCYATSTNPGEFVFEVQMTTIIGNCGGISDSFNTLIVCQDGTYSYDIYTSTSVNGYPAQPLLKSKAYSPAIKPGLNQTNVVAMVVMSHSITMYVNHQQIDRVDNNNIPSHPGSAAGLSMGYGNGGSQTGEVVFRDARVWALPA